MSGESVTIEARSENLKFTHSHGRIREDSPALSKGHCAKSENVAHSSPNHRGPHEPRFKTFNPARSACDKVRLVSAANAGIAHELDRRDPQADSGRRIHHGLA